MNEIIYGIHAISALVNQAPERLIEVFIIKERQDARLQPLIEQLQQQGIAIQWSSRQFLDKQSAQGVHQGIVARVKAARQYQENDLASLVDSIATPFILVLDGVTDPHNLGACLRTAEAAGVDLVIVPRNRSAQLNGTVRKVACGAAELVPLISVTNLARTLRYLQQQQMMIVGSAGEARQTLYQADLTGPLALVMGAEGEGMRQLTRQHCDQLISIPMQGKISSLNVSVATGVCLFEALRQRQLPSR